MYFSDRNVCSDCFLCKCDITRIPNIIYLCQITSTIQYTNYRTMGHDGTLFSVKFKWHLVLVKEKNMYKMLRIMG